MSLQWTIAAIFLYSEILVVLLLILPFISPKKWQSILSSRFLIALSRQASWYFGVLLFILALFLLDAIREMRKYSDSSDSGSGHAHQLELEMQMHMRQFRAQRNFYISGFALFLSLVIRRLIILIFSLAKMEAQSEAALKQAAGASLMANNLMEKGGIFAQNISNEAHDKEVNKLKSEISELKSKLEEQKREYDILKKQAEANFAEFDKVCEERNKLEKKLTLQSSGDKKDD